MLSRSRHGGVALAALIACALIAEPRPASAAPVDAVETFDARSLHTWQAGAGKPRLRNDRQRGGVFVTRRSLRRTYVLRRFDARQRVDLRLSFRRQGGGRQVLAALVGNRIQVRVGRGGTVVACVRHRCRSLGGARPGRRWHRVVVQVDLPGGVVVAGLDARRRVRLLGRLQREREARVGDLARDRGGPVAFDDLRVFADPAPAAPVPAPAPSGFNGRFFAADSVWNTPLADNAPLDPQSGPITAAFRTEIARQVSTRIGPWIQTTDGSSPIYTVPADQPRVRVKLDVTAAYGATLQQAFASVPIPATAVPAAGPDAHLTVHQPATDQLWEFWRMRKLADGWHAAWGGAMQAVSRSPGYFTAASWPGAYSGWGATATSLPLAGGMMLTSELLAGRIEHALAISVPDARAGVFSFPAQRTDGALTAATAIPEGARLRLDPRLNIAALGLPPMVHAMAVAAQRYGMIVRDKTYNATGFFAEDPLPTGGNPYPALLGGQYPNDLLAKFPWGHIQLVRMSLTSS